MIDWVKIFESQDVAEKRVKPGAAQLLIVRGIKICLVNYKNTFFAVQDACSHQRESLSKGSVNYLGEIICPLHHYRFSLSSGRECEERSMDLRTFPIKCNDSGFFIGL